MPSRPLCCWRIDILTLNQPLERFLQSYMNAKCIDIFLLCGVFLPLVQWYYQKLDIRIFWLVALVMFLKNVLSFLLFSDLLTATGFVVHVFLFRAIIQNAALFFWQALKLGNEKWLTQFSSSSFSFALLLSKTCTGWSLAASFFTDD